MALRKIAEYYTERFGVCPSITSKLCKSPYLKVSSNKTMFKIQLGCMSMIFHCTKLHLYIQVQRFVSCLHKTKYEI
jgi:hypothetical protein